MKSTLLTMLFASIILTDAAAQRIHFTDPTNQWKVVNDGGGTEYYSRLTTFKYQGSDTIFNGQPYKRLSFTIQSLQTNPGASAMINSAAMYGFREDTVSQKVYCFDARDSSETVIYNANWQVGDSIQSRYFKAHVSLQSTYYIRTIDSTNVLGQWYKVFHFNRYLSGATASSDAYAIIEGVGCTSGPAFPVSPYIDYSVGELGFNLDCFQTQATTPVISPAVSTGRASYNRSYDNATSCTSLAVSSLAQNDLVVSVLPSPATGKAVVHFSRSMQHATVVIYDLRGRTIYKSVIADKSDVDITQGLKVPGLYIYQVRDDVSNNSMVGKFTFE